MFDAEALGSELADMVRAYVAEQVGPLNIRLADLEAKNADLGAQLEARQAPELPDVSRLVSEAVAALPPAPAGKDADLDLIARLVSDEVGKIPAPQDGKSADMADVQRMVDEAVGALPVPKDGRDADPAVIAAQVRDAVDGAVVEARGLISAMIPEAVQAAVGELPPAEKGKDADPIDYDRVVSEVRALIPAPENGKDADPALVDAMVAKAVEQAVRALPVPKDGVGLAGALIDRDHRLTLTLSDGSTRDLGVVVGKSVDMAEVARLIQTEVAKIPAPKDGVDGFSLDDFDVEQKDGGRTVLLKFERGDTLHTFELSFPVVLDRGAFKDGDAYVAGDGVRWAGSWWIAQRDTKNKPGDGSEDWRMAVKCGRDGKSVDPAEVKTMVASEVAEVEKRLAAKVDQMLTVLANKAR